MRRWPDEIQAFSADVASLLTAPGNLRVWGWLNVVDRPESALFPGLALVARHPAGVVFAWTAAAHGEPAAAARAAHPARRSRSVFGIIAATPLWFGAWKVEIFGIRLLSVAHAAEAVIGGRCCSPSSRSRCIPRFAPAGDGDRRWRSTRWPPSRCGCSRLGPAPTFMGEPLLYKAPYSWLMMLPGVDGVRVPARFWVLATMCLAVAGALAVRLRRRAVAGAAQALVWLLAGVLLLEAWPHAARRCMPPPACASASHHTRGVRLEAAA